MDLRHEEEDRMTYIRIDPSQGMSVGQTMVDAGQRSMSALERLSSLGSTGGLGSYAGTVVTEIGYARAAIERAIEGWLRQGVDMLQRLNVLVAEQRASSVIGSVGTGPSAQALLGGSAIVGGGSSGFTVDPAVVTGVVGGGSIVGGTLLSGTTGVSSVLGGSAIVGGTYLGDGITAMGGGSAIVGGTYFGDGVTAMGGGPAIVGGVTRDMSGTMALAQVVQNKRERIDAALANMSAAGGAAGFTGGMDPITAAQTSRQFSDLMASQGIGTSLTLAPSGSRITSGGSVTPGFETTGTYGSSRIESPIKYD